VRRVNHSVEYKAEDGANVNQAQSYFSRLRRAEIGQHHRISGHLLHQYANEAAWSEDNRRKPNGTNWSIIIGASWLATARQNQLPPQGDDWFIWVLLAGRGFGKTRSLSEFVIDRVACGVARRIALVAATSVDARDVLVEGPSGLKAKDGG
jgi:hypothetical protein